MTAGATAPRDRVPRILAAALAIFALTASLAACASQPESSPPTPLRVAEGGAIDLVGMWRVSDAEGEAPETWLRLDAGNLHLWRDCGPMMGSWLAGSSIFTASVWGAAGNCASGGLPDVPWLTAATTYERTDAGWQLRNADGERVASLRIDGAPQPIPTVAEEYAQAPVVTDRTRDYFAQTLSLPSTLVPATAAQLVGEWVPTVSTPSDAHATFSSSGKWAGSDGCNGGAGQWSLGSEGEFVASAGPSTLMWCDGAAVPYWVATARLVGFDGDTLVLLDATGAELGRLVRG